MNNQGAIPGIVPTDTWGMMSGYGYGTGWDSALVYLPYYTAVLRDDMRAANESGIAFIRYFYYLSTRLNERGLLDYGLGDWCAPYKDKGHMAPVAFTDSVLAYDMAKKAGYLYRRMNREAEADYCEAFGNKIRAAIREHLIDDKEKMRFAGSYQTNQAMAIFYGICDNRDEEERAVLTLIEQIHEWNDHITVGVLGARVIFRVLCDNGYEDLALKLITRRDPPSYAWMIDAGLTTLSEKIMPNLNSQNHHFFGDISALMIEYFAGIRINPCLKSAKTVAIAPVFCKSMSFAEAYHDSVAGRISVRWDRCECGSIKLQLTLPEEIDGEVVAPIGYTVNGVEKTTATSGIYRFTAK
jgi:alpha-L-rhamnosidase